MTASFSSILGTVFRMSLSAAAVVRPIPPKPKAVITDGTRDGCFSGMFYALGRECLSCPSIGATLEHVSLAHGVAAQILHRPRSAVVMMLSKQVHQ